MATPFYRIDGTNVLPFLVDGGLTWSEEDIDSDNSGRSMDGTMHRGLVAKKDKHTLAFRELAPAEARTVLNLFGSQYVTVSTNIHPKRTGTVTFSMYNSSRLAASSWITEDGQANWQIQDLALIER